MMVTTYGLLSFEDCEFTLRPEIAGYHIGGDGRRYCSVLLSEIPLDKVFGFGKFELAPLPRKSYDPFRPYPLALNLPESFDFLSAPLVAEAVAALVSFCLRRRVRAYRRPFSEPVRDELQLSPDVFGYLPCTSVGPEGLLQQPLTPDEQSKRMTMLGALYEVVVRMERDDYLATIRAMHLYQLALLTLREDVGLAYTLLVASVETMAQRFVGKEDAPAEEFLKSSGWLSLIAREGVEKETAAKICKRVLDREQFLSFRFRRFVEQNLHDSFWKSPDSRAKELDDYIEGLRKEHFGENYIEEHQDHFSRWWWLYKPDTRVSKTELDDVLRDIYDLRSQFAHVGISPPRDVVDMFETARTKVLISDPRHRIEFVRSPPSFFWFERVANESISSFMLAYKPSRH